MAPIIMDLEAAAPAALVELEGRGAMPRHSTRPARDALLLAAADVLDLPELAPLVAGGHLRDCPGRKPPFLAVKRPPRPYKTAMQN